MTRRLIAASVLLLPLLAGCVLAPEPLRGEFSALAPREARQASVDPAGQRVRWGGRLLEVTRFDTHTCFLVAAEPLGEDARPYARGTSQGRFLACRAGAYDPAVFSPGRAVTFTGTVADNDVQPIAGGYRMPRIDADVVYLWPESPGDARVRTPSPYAW
ncbi:MAG TPA: Slp family lipoprotein [Arenimonas sp.]|uniref:Slp family lipoprotein n=1 Tax=Arenimonas sp. TaxID=1872635 RepID=UPI002D7E23CB|nr:Slp/YeaY family lipoprotein [Arenimonas sp.]HEU0153085.1 Slp family lipoprotein [Arenimonas sp.]